MPKNIVKTDPFFIVGTDRSGSTMLRLMLNQHPEIMVPRETWFFIVLMDHLPLDKPLTLDELKAAYNLILTDRPRRWRDLEITEDELFKEIMSLEAPTLAETINSVMSILTRRESKSIWGDKTPEYLVHIDRLHRVFPSARFIHIIRDGRDVCLSLLTKRWRGNNVRVIAKYWSDYIERGTRSGRSLPGNLYFEVKYEDLVLHTEKTLRLVCDFLGVEFDSRMTDFHRNSSSIVADWEKSHHEKTTRPPRTSDVGRWKTDMNKMELLAFEACAGTTMELMGQERYYHGVKRLLPLTFSLLDRMAEQSLPLRNKLHLHFSRIKKNI